jgi:cellulose synthase/poly-beta-1,6-N-acetylglucosamine synthase-like glycosyltransferase/peptidoglycan/xylan/chitin deacetylase (PgdA/CDA1 family)
MKDIQNQSTELPIFFDPTGIRWRISKVIIFLFLIFTIYTSIGLAKHYYLSYLNSKVINNFVKPSPSLTATKSSAILNPDYTSNYVTGSIKENIKYIDELIVNPFRPNLTEINDEGGFRTALEYYVTNNPKPTSILLKEKDLSQIKLGDLVKSNDFTRLIKVANANKIIFEISTQNQIDTYKDILSSLGSKFKTGFIINSTNTSFLNYYNNPVLVNFILNSSSPLTPQIDQGLNIYNQANNTTDDIGFILPSNYSNTDKSNTTKASVIELQNSYKQGETVKFQNNTPIKTLNKVDYSMYGKWFYYNFLNILYSKLPVTISLGINDLSNSESGLLKYLSEYQSKPDLDSKFKLSEQIITSGKGLIQNVESYGTDGRYNSTYSNGLLESVVIQTLPTQAKVTFTGQENFTTALTFDDGPAVFNSPKILNRLEKDNIKATFFVTGQQITKHPDTLKAISAAGHEIENHSFTHSLLTQSTDEQIDWEIAQTNNLIISKTGQIPQFFRVPYDAFGQPETTSDLRINKIAKKYNLNLYQIDSDVKDYIKGDTNEAESNIDYDNISKIGTQVLFHDGPDTDREETFEKLDLTINALQKAKIKLVTISYYNNNNQKKEVSKIEPWYISFITLNTYFIDQLGSVYNGLINFILVVSSFTVVVFIIFLFRNKKLKPKGDYFGSVTAIVPCYNEVKNVLFTVQSLLDNDMPGLKIIVVDDGSKDPSFIRLKTTFINNPRVKILTKKNGGKSTALNFGLKHVDTDYFVSMDSDTIFARDSVRMMMRHFADPKVSAVAGNVQLGNEYFNLKATDKSISFFKNFNWLTTCQRFEYITGQNFEKLAFNGMGCVIVVPGAIGCFRTADVKALGGYKEDTLAEDTNLTIELLKLGRKVRYEPDSLCFTEAPETLPQFYKQRFRWSFGTFQVAWKNKNILFNFKKGSLGMFAIPYMVFGLFNLILLPLTSLGILYFGAVLILDLSNIVKIQATDSKEFLQVLVLVCVFAVISFCRVLFSIYMDKSKNKYQIFLAYPLIITVYSVLLSFVTIRAFFASLKGQRQGWGHLVRKGSLSLNQFKSDVKK